MSPIEPTDPTPSHRAAPTGRAQRRGRFAPLAAAGTGVVLVAVSAVLLLHHRSLPDNFGAVPGDGSVIAAAPGRSSPLSATAPAPTTATTAPNRASTTVVHASPTATPDKVAGTSASSGTSATSASATTRSTSSHTSVPHTATRPTATRPAAPRTTATRSTAARPTPAADPRELPRQLVLPRFGIRADVLTVTSTDGTLAVPEDPQQVGWWAGSALPGSPSGTTVIDGHIDSATAGVGALIHLSDLAPGDRVSIIGVSGRTLDYDVVARRVYVKNAGLPPSLFAPGGSERLLLISCGGPFDSARGSYEDNIVVFATPAAD